MTARFLPAPLTRLLCRLPECPRHRENDRLALWCWQCAKGLGKSQRFDIRAVNGTRDQMFSTPDLIPTPFARGEVMENLMGPETWIVIRSEVIPTLPDSCERLVRQVLGLGQ